MEPQARARCQAQISHRLSILKESPSTAVPFSLIVELESILPLLFAGDYPQVLTHGDFSKSNVLVDLETYTITGIVDWSTGPLQGFNLLVLS